MLIDASAQTPPRRNAAIPTGAQDVNIIIQPQHVRFTTPHPVDQMHLRVADQTGEVVFDSGGASVLEIFWPLHMPDGAALKSGLYAYTLTVKEAQDKEARVRRGHFIVDRAQDRDGTDKLWVTSRDASGVGTELTVSKSENTTVAGTRTAKKSTSNKEALAEDIPDGEVVRSLNGLTDHVKLAGGQNVVVVLSSCPLNRTEEFIASDSIKVSSKVTLQPMGDVTLRAGRLITMSPEFKSEPGGKLTARIEPSLR
jgi:hypothetical protein